VIWDRLFGSYVEETHDDPPQYGIVERLGSNNPLVATFHEWGSMAADALRVDGWRNKLRAILGPPEWASAYHAQITEAANQDPRTVPLAAARDQ
ncbi:MAG: sterol desaturase family protein, partial [Burkholderia sp.]|nr:sterol desaturase family protein [Burkholderia sp.]